MVRAKRCCVHAYFRINVVSKRWFKTPKNVRLRSWLEQNADSGGSMNAKSHITTFKWRHINAFPVHLSSNNSLEQCAVHAHEIVFFSREAWTVLPWTAFWIGVSKRWFCLRKISMNAALDRESTSKYRPMLYEITEEMVGNAYCHISNHTQWTGFEYTPHLTSIPSV